MAKKSSKKSAKKSATPVPPIKGKSPLLAVGPYRSIPPEVWVVILSHLRNPFPKPLSRPPRSALRQPHLCAAALTCSLFYEICIPLLYTHICTDNLFSLIDANIYNFKDNLYHTKSLRIEYADKGKEPSYTLLMREGEWRWDLYGPPEDEKEEFLWEECAEEVRCLQECLEALNDAEREDRYFNFPALTSVAICSIYGKQGDLWERYNEANGGRVTQLSDVAEQFNILIQGLGTVEHLCIRDGTGPLGKSPFHHGADTFTRTLHFGSDYNHKKPDFSELYWPMGRKIRWVSDVDALESSQGLLGGLTERLGLLMRKREDFVRKDGYPIKKTDICDLEIWCSSDWSEGEQFDHENMAPRPPGVPMPKPYYVPPHIMDLAEQRRLTSELAEGAQRIYRQSSGLEDKIRWYLRSETPTCPSCGSGPATSPIHPRPHDIPKPKRKGGPSHTLSTS